MTGYVLYKNNKPHIGHEKGPGLDKATIEEIKAIMIKYGDAKEHELEIRRIK